MAAIFISYRRDDSAGFAGALEREITTRLGADRVFMDIKDIEGGTEFPAAIDTALQTSEVVLVLIGPRWLEASDGQGARRLDQPDDFVRQEVARALKREARVIPVLIEGAKLPTARQLPSDLQTLPNRQALELRNSHWTEDITALMNNIRESIFSLDTRETAVAKIEKDFNPIAPGRSPFRVMAFVALAIGVIFVAIGLGFFIYQLVFLSHATKVTGHVTNLLKEESRNDNGGTEIYYRPQLEYINSAGRTVRVTLGEASNPPTYEVGEDVILLVDPRVEYSRAIPDTFWGRWTFPIVFGGVGILVCVGAAVLLAWPQLRNRKTQRLLKEGKPILTTLVNVEEDSMVEVNGRHPFHVITQWRNPVSHEFVQFRSPALWKDPTYQVANRMITVVVDPNNLHRYLMDLSFLSGAAGTIIRRM